MDYKQIAKNIGFTVGATEKVQGKYAVVRGEFAGRPAILKVVGTGDSVRTENLKKEVAASKLIEKHNREFPDHQFNHLSVLNSGQVDGFHWFIRDYVDGDSLAVSQNAYDELRMDLIERYPDLFEQIITNYRSFLKIEVSDEVASFQVRFPQLAENEDLYLSREYKKISYGDLNPGNLIIDQKGRVHFTDLEWVCQDNFTMDVAYLWLFLWRIPRAQDQWLAGFIKNEQEKECFRISVLRMLKTFSWGEEAFADSNKFKERNTKWYDYLRAAEVSSDELISTK